jgi:hypothetical protein
MIDLIAHKLGSGDMLVNLARRHLVNHEWGAARMALEQGLAKGQLSDNELAGELLLEISQRLGVRRALLTPEVTSSKKKRMNRVAGVCND